MGKIFIVVFCIFSFGGILYSQQNLDKLLEMDLMELVNLKIISATKMPEALNQTPASVYIITREQIEENGYFTLEEALSDLPGFQFRNILGFNSYVFMRGIPSQNNLILLMVDGIQINELNSGGFYAGGQFNLSNVERIEVVYGPASALYGTNAVSGIINIITKEPEKEKEGSFSHLAGNFNTYMMDFYYGFFEPEKNLKFTISGMGKTTEKAELEGEKGGWNWSQNMENFEEDFSFESKFSFKNLSMGFLVQDKNASRATAQKTYGNNLNDWDVSWHIRFINFYTRYIFFEREKFSLKTTLYYRDTEVMDDTIPIIELRDENSDGKQYRYFRPANLTGQETFLYWDPSSKLNFSFGFVAEKERLSENFSITESSSQDEKPPKPLKPEMDSNELLSIFSQAKVFITDYFQGFFGFRYDSSSYYGDVFTPRMGLIYQWKKITSKILYMEAFRAPKPWDYTSGTGNKNLKPEEMNSLELATVYEFSNNLRFQSSFYRNKLDNLLIKEFLDDSFRWINSGSVLTKGAEFSIKYRKNNIKGTFDFTYNDSEDEKGKNIPEISKYTFGFMFYYYLNRNIGFGIRGRYYGERDNPKIILSEGNNKIDENFILNSSFNLKLRENFKIQLSFENLTNTTYYHPSNLPPDRYRQPGRTIRLKFLYDF